MYICLCNAITDNAIRKAVEEEGIGNIRELRNSLGVANQCGKCAQHAQTIIDQTVVDCSLFKEVS